VGTKSDEIVNQIDRQRDRLGQNLQELESRMRDVADWRAQYEKHPWAILGIAFVGGVVFGAWTRGNGGGSSVNGAQHHTAKSQILEGLRGALITLAVNKLKDYVAATIPSPGTQQG